MILKQRPMLQIIVSFTMKEGMYNGTMMDNYSLVVLV